jgi:hypothetical protein
MSTERPLQRVWRRWKYDFAIAIVVFILVFIFAYTYEVQREEEGIELEEPLEPFRVEASPRITAGSNTYGINITNDQAYTIRELTIEFKNIAPTAIDDFQTSYSDTLSPNTELQYSNPVQVSAMNLDVVLDGQEIVTGLTNLNLYVQKEGGTQEWSATSTGNDEELHLTQTDFENEGYGNYIATVRHEGGARDLEFDLTYTITYGEPVLMKTYNTPLEPGTSHEFAFTLNLAESDLSVIECSITAVVELGNVGSLPIVLIYNSAWELQSISQIVPEESLGDIPWGPVDLTGTAGAILYFITVITGFLFYIRIKIKEDFTIKGTGWAHCFFSLITMSLVLAHTLAALPKPWPWGSEGMVTAVLGLIVLGIFTGFSLFDVEFIERMGREKWRVVHLLLTFALVVFIVLHIGLMGDHLGFMK